MQRLRPSFFPSSPLSFGAAFNRCADESASHARTNNNLIFLHGPGWLLRARVRPRSVEAHQVRGLQTAQGIGASFTRLQLELGKERPQFQHCAHLAILTARAMHDSAGRRLAKKRWSRRRRRLLALAAARSTWPCLAGLAARRQALPAASRKHTGVIAQGDERLAAVLDDIEARVSFM